MTFSIFHTAAKSVKTELQFAEVLFLASKHSLQLVYQLDIRKLCLNNTHYMLNGTLREKTSLSERVL